MQTSLRRSHRNRVVRRGIGMNIESDFYTYASAVATASSPTMLAHLDAPHLGRTEAGRKHFTDQLSSIRYCVQETW